MKNIGSKKHAHVRVREKNERSNSYFFFIEIDVRKKESFDIGQSTFFIYNNLLNF
jgi:hypothetical protein